MLTHYWGGDKMNIRQDLEENGYEAYEASISAFGSNYDRAVGYTTTSKVDVLTMVQHTQLNMVMSVTVKPMKVCIKIGNQVKNTFVIIVWVVKQFAN